jgi:hypothetical protein
MQGHWYTEEATSLSRAAKLWTWIRLYHFTDLEDQGRDYSNIFFSESFATHAVRNDTLAAKQPCTRDALLDEQ